MIYRIYTEDKQNEKEIAKLALRYFDGFNIGKVTGYDSKVKEPSLYIEIDDLGQDKREEAYRLAEDIKLAGRQKSVLLQIIGDKSILV